MKEGEYMRLMIHITDPDIALKVCRICNDFKFEIDALNGRLAIDAKSALGMQGLVGADVEIRPVHNDVDYERLFERIVEIGGRLEEDFKKEQNV